MATDADFDGTSQSADDGNQKKGNTSKLAGGLFLASVAGLSILGGFGMTIAMAKKKDPAMFNKGMLATREIPESGSSLAARALAWGTVYSVTGVSLFCFGFWKLLGVNNMSEFTAKMQSVMPRLLKKPIEEQGRNDFKTVREVIQYILEEDAKKRDQKKHSQKCSGTEDQLSES